MAIKDDIAKMYDSLYKSKLGALENSRNEALLGLANREKSISNNYVTTESNLNKQREDTKNSYLDRYTQLDNEYQKGEKKYYNDRDNAALGNSRNTQAIRDYMARANLIQSGESVDALLRNNTDHINTQNSIYAQENEFKRDLGNTRSQYQRDEASTYAGFDNQLAAAMRDRDLNLAAILSEREQANKSYNSSLESIKSEVEYARIKELNDYNKMLEERAYQQQLAAASRSYSGGSGSSSGGSSSYSDSKVASDLKNEVNYLVGTNDYSRMETEGIPAVKQAYNQGYIDSNTYNKLMQTLNTNVTTWKNNQVKQNGGLWGYSTARR